MIQSNDIKYIFETLQKEYNDIDNTELKYYNHYQLLIAIMLSAQATDRSVNLATKKLFPILQNPEDAIKLGYEKINNYIKTINYHNVKSQNIIKLSEKLIKEYKSKVPDNFEELVKLNGIGRKTANVFLNVAYNKNTIAVDTHVFRTSNRLGIVKANDVFETEKQLIKNVNKKYHKDINKVLVLFGRYVCKAKNPKCNECKFKKICNFYNNKIK